MNIKSNYFYNTLNQMLNIMVSVITIPYISRVLGVSNIGIYSYSYSIVSYFIMFIMLGLSNYGNREIARVKHDSYKLNSTFFSIYLIQLIAGVIVSFCYLGFVDFCITENRIIFILQFIYIISAVLDINWALHGLEKFKQSALKNTIITLLNFFAILLFIHDKDSLYVYILILGISNLFNQILSWLIIVNKINYVKINIVDSFIHLKPILTLFIPIIAVSLYKIMDKIMLGNLSNMEQVGFYESSEKIIKIPTIFISSLGTVMLPRMAQIYSSGDSDLGKKYIDNSIEIAVLISSVLCFGIMGISKEFIPFFYGKGYDTCISLYLILLPSCIFLAFSNVIRTQYLIPNRQDFVYIKGVILGAITNLFFNCILIPRYQAIGAAIGTTIAEFMVCFSQSMDIRNELPIKKYIFDNFPYVILGIIMFLILYTINISLSSIFILLIKTIIGFLIYLLGLIMIKIINKYL